MGVWTHVSQGNLFYFCLKLDGGSVPPPPCSVVSGIFHLLFILGRAPDVRLINTMMLILHTLIPSRPTLLTVGLKKEHIFDNKLRACPTLVLNTFQRTYTNTLFEGSTSLG